MQISKRKRQKQKQSLLEIPLICEQLKTMKNKNKKSSYA
jgi:hypothetical protein